MSDKWEHIDYDEMAVGDEVRIYCGAINFIVGNIKKVRGEMYACSEGSTCLNKSCLWERKLKEQPVNEKLEGIIAAVIEEFKEATSKFGSYNSAHEGYAVIHEELDELWDEVKKKKKSKKRMREEAIQVAVTAIRFIHDVTGETEE